MLDTSSKPAVPPATEEPEEGLESNRLVSALANRRAAVSIAAACLFVVFSFSAPNFLTTSNLLSIAQGYALYGIVGVGMTYLLIAGELDLSVGALNAFSGIIMAWLIANGGVNVWIALLLTLLLGVTVGAVNGFVTTIMGVPSFIVTLGMLSVLEGAGLVVSGGLPIDVTGKLGPTFTSIANGHVGSVPSPAIWVAGIALVGAVVLRVTPFGHQVYATGGNRRAAQQVGIRTSAVRVACFMMTGTLAAFAGILNLAVLSEGSPQTGPDFVLTVIAAVIIGGTALYGGEGTVIGTILGAAILGMIADALVLMGWDSNLSIIFTGAIVIGVGAANVYVNNKQRAMQLNRLLQTVKTRWRPS
jgi:ribose transport system permease protein